MSGAHFESDAADRRSPGDGGGPRLARLAPAAGVALLSVAVAWTLAEGVGVWGLDRSLGWAAEAAGLAFWLGLALAGVVVSTALSLFDRPWWGAIRATTAATTVAAAACAATLAAVHLGRPRVAYWLLPLPNQMGTWPHYGSPIAWSVLAVGVAAALTAAWKISPRGERADPSVNRALAGTTAAAALVALALVAASSEVSPLRGAHGALVVPTFAVGAILSGLAATLGLVAWGRRDLGAEPVTGLARLVAATGLALGALVVVDFALAALAGDAPRRAAANRLLGPAAPAFWAAFVGSVVAPQLLRLPRLRAARAALVAISLAAAAAIALDRLAAAVAPLERGLLPATWTRFAPTVWDVALAAGSVALFAALHSRFARPRPGSATAAASDGDGVETPPVPPPTLGAAAE